MRHRGLSLVILSLLVFAVIPLSCSRSRSAPQTPDPPTPDLEPPVILAMTPGEIGGVTGDERSLKLTIDGEAETYIWTLGDGSFPRQSTAEEPNIVLTRPGIHTLQVVASNDAGNSEPFQLQYEVATSPMPVWKGYDAAAFAGNYLQGHWGVVDDRLIVVMPMDDYFDIQVFVSQSPLPASRTEWSGYICHAPKQRYSGYFDCLFLENGVAVAYRGQNWELMFGLAADGVPMTSDAWEWSTVTDTIPSFARFGLFPLQGRPVLGYSSPDLLNQADDTGFSLAYPLILPPAGPADWVHQQIASTADGYVRHWESDDAVIAGLSIYESADPKLEALWKITATGAGSGPLTISTSQFIAPTDLDRLIGIWGTPNYSGILGFGSADPSLVRCYWQGNPLSASGPTWEAYDTGLQAINFHQFKMAGGRPALGVYTQWMSGGELGTFGVFPKLQRTVTPEPTAASDWLIDPLPTLYGDSSYSLPPIPLDLGDRVGMLWGGNFWGDNDPTWLLFPDQPW